MTNQENVNRNIGLTFDLIHQILENPVILDKIPEKSEIIFLEKDFNQIQKSTSKSKLIKVKSKLELV